MIKTATLMLCYLAFSCGLMAQDQKIRIPIVNSNEAVEFVGELGKKLGETLTVEGVFVESTFKKGQGQQLRISRINNVATQRVIRIPVVPFWGNFGDRLTETEALPNLEIGSAYSFRGFESGGFTGSPNGAHKELDMLLDIPGFHFRNWLEVYSGKKTRQVDFSPNDFIDREALFSGKAVNVSGSPVIQFGSWTLCLDKEKEWNDIELGKKTEVFGVIQKTETENVFAVKNGRIRLVNLEDQIGKKAKLRGIALSLNGNWWFNYRGTDLYVENMKGLTNWTSSNHGRAIEISGTLGEELLPSIDEIYRSKPKIRKHYIVRDAKWTSVKELLIPELRPNIQLGK